VSQELLLGPPGLVRHLRQVAAAPPALHNVYPVLSQLQLAYVAHLAERRQHGDLYFYLVQLLQRYGREPVVLRGRSHRHLRDHFVQRLVRCEPSYAAPELPVLVQVTNAPWWPVREGSVSLGSGTGLFLSEASMETLATESSFFLSALPRADSFALAACVRTVSSREDLAPAPGFELL